MVRTFDSVEEAQDWQKAANDAAATSHFTKTMSVLTRTLQDQLKENHCLDVASTPSPEKEQDAVIAINKDIDLATTHDITASFLERTHPFKQDSALRESTLYLHKASWAGHDFLLTLIVASRMDCLASCMPLTFVAGAACIALACHCTTRTWPWLMCTCG